MHFSIPSLLSISCLALLASTGLAAGHPRRYNSMRTYQDEAGVEIYPIYTAFNLILDDKLYDDLKFIFTANATLSNFGSTYSTLPVIEELAAELTTGPTLHTTENIYIDNFKPELGKPTSATVTLDESIIYFGQGNYTGQITTQYVRVTDIVVEDNGGWKIQTRKRNRERIIGPKGILP